MAIGSAAVEGFALSIGLILALGPQNVFVMRQGLLRSHVFAVCLACSIFDAALIAAGVLGMGSILSGICLLYTSPSPRDKRQSRMPSSA